MLPQAYANALRDKPAGSTVGPFQTEGGWAVLRVEDRRKETPPTLEQARPQIVRYLTYEGVRQLLEQLRGKAEVEVLLNGSGASREPASAPAAGGDGEDDRQQHREQDAGRIPGQDGVHFGASSVTGGKGPRVDRDKAGA